MYGAFIFLTVLGGVCAITFTFIWAVKTYIIED